MDNPVTVVKEASKGVNMKFIWNVFLALLAILLLVGIVYWYKYLRGISWKNIKALVAQEAVKYEKPADVEKILLAGVRDIVTDFGLLSQARTYASQNSISIDRVLVNNAIALAKDYEYIK